MLRRLFLFFFLSGFSALIYEVAWVRELALTLGNTAQATSIVLAVFMGGLALGAYAGGRIADRPDREPLALYGMLEIAIAVLALVVSFILIHSGHIYTWLIQHLPLGENKVILLRLIMSSSLLLLPTLFMGATLPVLVRFLEKSRLPVRFFSIFYGLNTLGAATGSLLACFVGFAYLGINGTLIIAACINLIIGVLSIALSRTPIDMSSLHSDKRFALDATTTTKEDSADSETGAEVADEPERISPITFCSIAFMTGFTSLSYEVLWTKILRWYLTSLTYSFTIMVSLFLLGLAIGSLIYERLSFKFASHDTNGPYIRFGVTQYLAALACACSLPFFPFIDVTAKQWLVFLTPHISALHSQLIHQIVYISLVSIPTILIPAIFIGMLFPMLGTLAASRARGGATAVGTVYAYNTVGCVCGSLICGLVLVPTIGSIVAFQWIVVLSAVTGAIAILYATRLSILKRLVYVFVPIILTLSFTTVHFHSNLPPGYALLAEGEDTTGIMRIIDMPRSPGVMLELNGSSLASTTPANLRYMRMMAHLPMLLHKNPENVLVACYGTGTTAGALSLYPDLKKLDIVELSKMVLSAAPYFKKTNYDVLTNPKVSVHINDVRSYLLSNQENYDVITFEPPPPTFAGVVNLYSEEFYGLVSNRLKKDGLVCQWIPMHVVSGPLWEMMIASARAVFPYVSIWIPDNQEALLLASKEPIDMDFVKMQNRMNSNAKLKQSFVDVGFDNPMGVLATFVASGPELDEAIKNSVSITDNYPHLEFYMPYLGPHISQLGAEAIGLEGLKGFVAHYRHAPGFDEEEFWKNWQAIHLLREVESSKKREEADKFIDQARDLLPENHWFKQVARRRESVYPNNLPSFSN